MCVLAEGNHAAVGAVVDGPLIGVELRVEAAKEGNALFERLVGGVGYTVEPREEVYQRATDRDAGPKVTGVRPDRLVSLIGGVGEAPALRAAGVGGIIAHGDSRRTVHGAVLEAREESAMPAVGALIHDDVDHATQRAAVLSLDAGGLQLHFLDEVHGDVGVRVATDKVACLLTFNEVGVLRVCAATDGEADAAAVGAVARRGAAGAVAALGIAHERLVAGRGGKLNDRLEGRSVGNILKDIYGNVGECSVGGGINQWSLGADLDHGPDLADFELKVNSRKMTDLKNQSIALQGFKSLRLHCQRVGAWRDVGETVVTAGISLDLLGADEVRSRDNHLGAGNDCA